MEAPSSSEVERLEVAEKLREEGNTEFKAQQVLQARQKYDRALTLLDLKGFQEEHRERATACRAPTLLNLALCCLKLDPPEAHRALECCEEVLDLDPTSAKAMYRKAKALIELDELREAEWELVRACKLVPQDAAMRRDLEQLRRRQQERLDKQKATFEGLFERGPGFASENRARSSAAPSLAQSKDMRDLYFHDDDENPYESMEDPRSEALKAQADGRLGDAVQAWEASLSKAASQKDWAAHFTDCLDMGRLFMDINMDNLALRCFNKVLEPPEAGPDDADHGEPRSPAQARRHALLLKAICLLNEAEGDPKAEVTACLELWTHAEDRGPPLDEANVPLDHRLAQWREAKGAQADADSAVALGLLLLLQGPSSAAPSAFAAAIQAPDMPGACFSGDGRAAAKWNMLGAVLANRRRFSDAMLVYSHALGFNQHYPRALINQAIAQASLGDHRAAAASYVAALGKIPIWSTDALWVPLRKVAGDMADGDDLVEAVEKRNITKARDLLAPELAELAPGASKEPACEVLARLGFPPP